MLENGEDCGRSVTHKYCIYLESRFREVRHYFTAAEVINFTIFKSSVDFSGFHNNQLIDQRKYLE
jgi:hypothetical protein